MAIDPLLYNPRNLPDLYQEQRIDSLKKNLSPGQKPEGKDFPFLESLRAQLPKNSNLSTDHLSSVPSRQQVLAHSQGHPERQSLYEAAKQFESYFVEQMFREMKKNVPQNELFHGGRAEEIFDDLLLTERVKDVSGQSEFGLAEMMYRQLQGL